jgi:hypothetical protein
MWQKIERPANVSANSIVFFAPTSKQYSASSLRQFFFTLAEINLGSRTSQSHS